MLFQRLFKIFAIACTLVFPLQASSQGHSGSLEEIVSVWVTETTFLDAIQNILPDGWAIKIDKEGLETQLIDVVSSDYSRLDVIRSVLEQHDARGYFYQDLKVLLIVAK